MDIQTIETIAKLAGAVVASAAALGVVFRWLVIPFFINPVLTWYRDEKLGAELAPMRDDLSTLRSDIEAIKPMAAEISQTLHLVSFHLGWNGTTQPVRDRLLIVETQLSGVSQDLAAMKTQIKDK